MLPLCHTADSILKSYTMWKQDKHPRSTNSKVKLISFHRRWCTRQCQPTPQPPVKKLGGVHLKFAFCFHSSLSRCNISVAFWRVYLYWRLMRQTLACLDFLISWHKTGRLWHVVRKLGAVMGNAPVQVEWISLWLWPLPRLFLALFLPFQWNLCSLHVVVDLSIPFFKEK